MELVFTQAGPDADISKCLMNWNIILLYITTHMRSQFDNCYPDLIL